MGMRKALLHRGRLLSAFILLLAAVGARAEVPASARYDPPARSAGLSRAESGGAGQAVWTTSTSADGPVDTVFSILPERIGWLSALGIALALVAYQTLRVVRRDRMLRRAERDLGIEIAERMDVEKEVREREEKWRSITEYSPDYIMLLDRNANILFINHTVPGLTREQVIGTCLYDYVEKEYVQPMRECFERVLETGAPDMYEITYRYENGELRYFESHVGPVRSGDAIEGLTVSSRDITERRQMEAALKEREERFRSIAESAADAIVVSDSSGEVVFWSGAARAVFGYEEAEILGKQLSLLMPQRYRDAHQEGLERLKAAGESRLAGRTVELHGLRKDGSEFPMEISLANWRTGEEIFFGGIIRDITERRRMEAEGARLDTQLQQLRYLYRLRSALEDTRSPGEVARRTGEALMEVLSVSASAGVRIEHDGRLRTFGEVDRDGQICYSRRLAWGERERGQLTICCGVELSESQERALLDETVAQVVRTLQTRELEMQILQSARLVSLGQMAAGVAHEINQPLGAISATAEDYYLRLRDGMEVSGEQWQTMLKRILGMVERMSGTVDHLRVFSRDSSQEPGVQVSVNDVIYSGLSLIGTQLENHGIDLHLDLAEGLPKALGHPRQLEQVFLNLLGNARDALDEREGERAIRERTAGPMAKRLAVRTRLGGDGDRRIVAEVADNGAGIEEADLGRVFEPFFTTKEADRGTGLGLSISYAIVKNHGGQISCESRKGEGATFRVTLPIAGEV